MEISCGHRVNEAATWPGPFEDGLRVFCTDCQMVRKVLPDPDPVESYDEARCSEETAKALDEFEQIFRRHGNAEAVGVVRAFAHEHGWHLSSCEGGFRAVDEGFTTLSQMAKAKR